MTHYEREVLSRCVEVESVVDTLGLVNVADDVTSLQVQVYELQTQVLELRANLDRTVEVVEHLRAAQPVEEQFHDC